MLISEKDQEESCWTISTVMEVKSPWLIAHTMDGESLTAAIQKTQELLAVSIQPPMILSDEY